MQPSLRTERTLTELDFTRLSKLPSGNLVPELADLLSAADVLGSREVPADTITMYSQVELEDVHTHRRQKLTICYPDDAEPSAGFISVRSSDASRSDRPCADRLPEFPACCQASECR